MSSFKHLDKSIINGVLKRAKSYYLSRQLYSLIEDASLKKELDLIADSLDEVRENNGELTVRTYGILMNIMRIAIIREFIDLIEELLYNKEILEDTVRLIGELGNLELLKYITEGRSVDVEITLSSAVVNGDLDMIDWILGEIAPIEEPFEYVSIALEAGRLDIAEKLIKHSSKLSGIRFYGDELLHSAVFSEDLSTVKYVIERFEVDDFDEAFSSAVDNGSDDIVRELLNRLDITELDSEYKRNILKSAERTMDRDTLDRIIKKFYSE